LRLLDQGKGIDKPKTEIRCLAMREDGREDQSAYSSSPEEKGGLLWGGGLTTRSRKGGPFLLGGGERIPRKVFDVKREERKKWALS